ncbi:hypothetical protein [Streptomyces sp. W1SF4]|uniref:hypothetical protein n=1 Tax=Streptomyces sp. W1SF4 TaxID=2305220 RepID=UPI000F6BF00B|nr:hypothetical protein [Streptomyces sp. W1SF4]AZM90270.1 hypothetical protein D1J60_18945 [Streptomyces sp. W1SF4]
MAVESAELESRLRHTLSWLAGDDDAGWIVFEGQSVDWLISNGRAVLGQHAAMKRWPAEQNERLLHLLPEIQEVNRTRNFIVHGLWAAECFLDEDCEQRPQHSPLDDRLFHVVRSRYRKGYQEREVAVSDIDELADRMVSLAASLDEAVKAARDAWLGKSEIDV